MVLSSTSKLALALSLLVGSAFADGPYTRSVARGTVGAGGGSAVGGSGIANQVTYWLNGNTITGDPSFTYTSGIVGIGGVSASGVVTASTAVATNRLTDAGATAITISPANGLTRGVWINTGLFVTGAAAANTTASSTLHVSGTTRITSWTAIGANTAASVALDVFGTVSASGLALNTATVASNTQILYLSGTTVDGANGINYDRQTDFTAFGATPALTSFTPSATIHVSGTAWITGNVSITTGYVHLGSPTTIPTCNAANKGNTFMNTTTNCLNYCDGTANRQVTSVAASCT